MGYFSQLITEDDVRGYEAMHLAEYTSESQPDAWRVKREQENAHRDAAVILQRLLESLNDAPQ